MSPEAQVLLDELYGRPEWKEIIEEIEKVKIPRFKPIKQPDHQQEAQFYNWVFYSGRALENDRITKILTGERNHVRG